MKTYPSFFLTKAQANALNYSINIQEGHPIRNSDNFWIIKQATGGQRLRMCRIFDVFFN